MAYGDNWNRNYWPSVLRAFLLPQEARFIDLFKSVQEALVRGDRARAQMWARSLGNLMQADSLDFAAGRDGATLVADIIDGVELAMRNHIEAYGDPDAPQPAPTQAPQPETPPTDQITPLSIVLRGYDHEIGAIAAALQAGDKDSAVGLAKGLATTIRNSEDIDLSPNELVKRIIGEAQDRAGPTRQSAQPAANPAATTPAELKQLIKNRAGTDKQLQASIEQARRDLKGSLPGIAKLHAAMKEQGLLGDEIDEKTFAKTLIQFARQSSQPAHNAAPEGGRDAVLAKLRSDFPAQLAKIRALHEADDPEGRSKEIQKLLTTLAKGKFIGDGKWLAKQWWNGLKFPDFMEAATGRPAAEFANLPPAGPADMDAMDAKQRAAYFKREFARIADNVKSGDMVKAKVRSQFVLEDMRKADPQKATRLTADKLIELACLQNGMSGSEIGAAMPGAASANAAPIKLTLAIVGKVDWDGFNKLYSIPETSTDAVTSLATKIVKSGVGGASTEAKNLMVSFKKAKAKVDIKDAYHLSKAVEDALLKKAAGTPLRKKLKASDLEKELSQEI